MEVHQFLLRFHGLTTQKNYFTLDMICLSGIITVILFIPNFTYRLSAEAQTPTTFSEQEKKALQKFRSLVAPVLYRDFMRRDEYLIRWIRYQDFNLQRAEHKLRAAIRWRKANNIDTVLKEDFSGIEKLCSFSLDGRDKSGRPILTLQIGNWQMRKLVISGNIEKLQRMMFYVFELRSKLVENLQAQGKPIEDGLVIADFNNFKLTEQGCLACIPILLEVITLYEAYYPQYVYAFLLINVPWALETLLPMVLPNYLSEKSRNGLYVYGYNKYDWRDAIRTYVDDGQVEPSFGGNKDKPAPVAKHFRATIESSGIW